MTPPPSSHSNSPRLTFQSEDSGSSVDSGSVPASKAETEVAEAHKLTQKRRRLEEDSGLGSPPQKKARAPKGTKGSATGSPREGGRKDAKNETATGPTQPANLAEPFYPGNSFSEDMFENFRESGQQWSDEDADEDTNSDANRDTNRNSDSDLDASVDSKSLTHEAMAAHIPQEPNEQTQARSDPPSRLEHDVDMSDEGPKTSQMSPCEGSDSPDYEGVWGEDSLGEAHQTEMADGGSTASGDEFLKSGGDVTTTTTPKDFANHEQGVSITETFTGRQTTIILPRPVAKPSSMADYLPDHNRVDEYDPERGEQARSRPVVEYRPDHDHNEEYNPASPQTSILSGRPEGVSHIDESPINSSGGGGLAELLNPRRKVVFARKPPHIPPWVSDTPVKPGTYWRGDTAVKRDGSVWDARWEDQSSVGRDSSASEVGEVGEAGEAGEAGETSDGERTDWESEPGY